MTFSQQSPHEMWGRVQLSDKKVDDQGDTASSGEEQGQSVTSIIWNADDPYAKNEGSSQDGERKDIQPQRGLSALDRVLSRTSVTDRDPGPPPDGGFWAWASGKWGHNWPEECC